MLRPFGMILMLPMLSGRALGGSLTRNCLVLLLALPVVPLQMASDSTLLNLSMPLLVLLGLKEVTIGIMIGFCVAIPFWAIETAGTINDTIRGTSMASALNPLIGDQSSVFGILLGQVLVVGFFAAGGFNATLQALYDSYITLPTNGSILISADFPGFIMQQWRAMLDLSISFAIPAIVIMVIIDIALGFVNRSAQQMNVFFIAMPIKSAAALFILTISMVYGMNIYSHHYMSINETTRALIDLIRTD